jgi:hypothetical protein
MHQNILKVRINRLENMLRTLGHGNEKNNKMSGKWRVERFEAYKAVQSSVEKNISVR